jgi:hypothetical protein
MTLSDDKKQYLAEEVMNIIEGLEISDIFTKDEITNHIVENYSPEEVFDILTKIMFPKKEIV